MQGMGHDHWAGAAFLRRAQKCGIYYGIQQPIWVSRIVDIYISIETKSWLALSTEQPKFGTPIQASVITHWRDIRWRSYAWDSTLMACWLQLDLWTILLSCGMSKPDRKYSTSQVIEQRLLVYASIQMETNSLLLPSITLPRCGMYVQVSAYSLSRVTLESSLVDNLTSQAIIA